MNHHCHRMLTARLPGLIMLLAAAALLLAGSVVAASDEPGNRIRSIDHSVLPGNRIEIRLEMERPTDVPRSFTIRDPARIALDFPDTVNATGQRSIPIDVAMARSVDIAEADDRTRVVVNLSELPDFNTRSDGNTILLTLGDRGDPAMVEAPTADPEPFVGEEVADAPAPEDRRIEDIDFRRGPDGEGRVIVTLSDPDIPVNLDREADAIHIDMLGTTIPEHLRERLDVTDFATPIRFVDIRQRRQDGRISIRPVSPEYEQIAYQSDRQFTIELRPLTPDEVAERELEEPEYTGDQLSLNFQDIEVRSVLSLLADFTGLNVVVSDSVTGNVTLRLDNVPWDQALDIVLQLRGLGMRESGNVLFIAPAEEIAQREQRELERQQEQEELAPLQLEYIQVNYARASDLASLLQADDTNLLSSRASVSVDQRTNTLIVRDTSRHLEQARRMVNRLDIPVRQVLIESRIVIATDDFNRELGVRFGAQRRTGDATGSGELDGRFAVDMPAISPSGSLGLALTKLPLGTLLELELSAMQAEGRGEIISSPRVITSNQNEASIQQGVEIPFQEAAASGATAVSFREAVLGLNVTPQITPDDRIIMDLRVTRDTVGQVFAGIPSIDTRAVETQVLVDNGETVVLGGIYEQTTSEQVERVPFFGDLPIVGHLFRSTLVQDDKSELLVFVTPQIVRDTGDTLAY